MSNSQQFSQQSRAELEKHTTHPVRVPEAHLLGAGQERGEEHRARGSSLFALRSELGNWPNSCDATTHRTGRASASAGDRNWDVNSETVYTQCLKTISEIIYFQYLGSSHLGFTSCRISVSRAGLTFVSHSRFVIGLWWNLGPIQTRKIPFCLV